ncbi:phosphatidylinositol transfer protein 3-like [Zingiber officinale]|uniref:phosphatidylinositol transfer protein 3-like n=1 Tax=Zingiber officinale TaxID=94328 RepID=UPI001C4AA207|nr:phosphatidylinositol transfer protein 3-like [Zingiber officinale]
MSSVDSGMNFSEKLSFSEKQREKINEVRASLGSLPDKLRLYASDVSIARYLTARNWNVQKATKMLKETLKWRLEYEPEKIHWDEIASEAETGKIYRTSFSDKLGRSILVMRPRCENSKSIKGKIRYLVYCMENAILNLPSDQEQMVWLIDFKGFDLSNISIRTTKATADVLQNHYPERLGLAILYNPPKFFEPFWNIAKHLLEPKTYRKVKFVYPNDDNSKMIMEEFFNMDELDCAFGGNSQVGFNINDYAARMRDDEQRMPFFWCQENGSSPEKSATLDDNFSAGNCESEPDSRGTIENGVVGSSNTIGTSLP